MRWLGVLIALPCLVAACGSGRHQSTIRVTLTAQNHRPRAGNSPSVQWWYCVKVRAAGGKSVGSKIRFQILSDGTTVGSVGTVWLRTGYDHWCASIGGKYSVLHAVPRGKTLVFQAVVTANGATVKRDWPIIVR